MCKNMAKRTIGKAGLLFAAMGSIIGSGWLFGPYYAAQIAGPAALISWVLGGLIMIVIALTFAELSTMLPIVGGIARFAQDLQRCPLAGAVRAALQRSLW